VSQDDLVGAWIDNYNRTVYFCACDLPGCLEIYWTMTLPNTTLNTTYFGWGTVVDDRFVSDDTNDLSGKYHFLTSPSDDFGNKTKIAYRKFHLNQHGSWFKGKLETDLWILKRRIYKEEPPPGACYKVARAEKVPKLIGKWVRPVGSHSLYLNICPDGKGFFQSSQGLAGKFKGDFDNFNLTWYGKRYIKNVNNSFDLTGTTAFGQVGSSILVQVDVDLFGRFVERNSYSYLGGPSWKDCDLDPPTTFPVPWENFSLLAYPFVLIDSYLASFILGRMG
jgi:hypothetical protein